MPPQPSRATHWTLPQKRTSLNLRQQHTIDFRIQKLSSHRGLCKRASLGDGRQSLGMVAFSLLSKASRTELQAVFLHIKSSALACFDILLQECASDVPVGPTQLNHKEHLHAGAMRSGSTWSLSQVKAGIA